MMQQPSQSWRRTGRIAEQFVSKGLELQRRPMHPERRIVSGPGRFLLGMRGHARIRLAADRLQTFRLRSGTLEIIPTRGLGSANMTE
jgi:hypothetical protein